MLNKVELIGHIGAINQLKQLENNKKVLRFTVATTEFNGTEKKTVWHTVALWDNLAETMSKYIFKGQLVYIQGRITYSEYLDKQSGIKKTYTVITADLLRMLSKKVETVPTEVNNEQVTDMSVADTIEPSDEMPF